MAKSQGWRIIGVLILGIAGTTAFFLYGPSLQQEWSRQTGGGEKAPPPKIAEMDKAQPAAPGKPEMKAIGPLGPGGRFQLVSDGKQTFLADLKEGRVWRYYHYTRDDGHLKEEEGFLPLPFFFGGKKYGSAGEVENGE